MSQANAVEAESYRILRSRLDLSALPPLSRAVTERVIHATASGGGVRYDVLGEGERGRWFSDHLVSARRLAAERAPASEGRPDESLDPPDTAPAAPR